MVYVWLVLVIVLGLIEIMTVNLVSIWFVLSGILALITSLITDKFFIQFAVFVIFGTLFMVLIRKYLEPKIMKEKVSTNIDRVIGMKGVVTETIEEEGLGEVKVDGKKWSATSKQSLKKGEYVKVLKIKSVKLEVERWEE